MKQIQRRGSPWLGIAVMVTVALTGVFASVQSAGTLDIYWIDVEGGASTLIVTPGGQSVLMDAGFDGFNDRDASRIARVVREEAGLKRLDHVLISHFHGDHAGGLAALAKRVEIGSFIDHGETVEKGAGRAVWDQVHHRRRQPPPHRQAGRAPEPRRRRTDHRCGPQPVHCEAALR